MSHVFVVHDRDLIRLICLRVAVMCPVKSVESGPTDQNFAHAGHPCTRAPIDGNPNPARCGRAVERLPGSASGSVDPDPNPPFRRASTAHDIRWP
jgi:ABC-type dipeptide/oligopeptide/nickel transport system ATPase component